MKSGAENIKNLREKIGLTQTEFAYNIGIAQTTLSQYENGGRYPSIKKTRQIIKLASKYGIKISFDDIRPD